MLMDVDGAQNSVALWDSLRDLQDKSLTPRRYQPRPPLMTKSEAFQRWCIISLFFLVCNSEPTLPVIDEIPILTRDTNSTPRRKKGMILGFSSRKIVRNGTTHDLRISHKGGTTPVALCQGLVLQVT